MPIAILMILLLLPAQSWAGGLWGSEGQDVARVQVTEAYLSWRTGPRFCIGMSAASHAVRKAFKPSRIGCLE